MVEMMYLVNAVLYSFSGAVWFLCFAFGKMEWYSVIVGILFLTAGAFNLIAYMRVKKKTKDIGEANG